MLNRALFLCAILTWVSVAGQERNNDYYESDEYWNMPDSGRRCKPGQMVEGADSSTSCVPCPAGSYNFEGARVDACFPCPFGTFGNMTGMTGCMDCENWEEMRRGKYMTKQHGSMSAKQCLRPDEAVGGFVTATVGFKVKVKGGDYCTNIKAALWGVSKVAPFDAHFYQCDYTPKEGEEPAFTSMAMELTLPRNMAFDVWGVLDMVNTHRVVGNAYVKLGRHYLNKISEFLKNHSDMKSLGFDLKVDLLKIDDIEIMEFEPYFKGNCPIAGDNSQFCDEKDPEKAAKVQRYYVKYSVNVDCDTNAAYTRVKNVIERSAERGLACLSREGNDKCAMELVSCQDGKVVAALTNFYSGEENSLSFSQFQLDSNSFSDDDIQFDKEQSSAGCTDNEAGSAVFDFNEDFVARCGKCEAGQFLNSMGMCKSCPFGSWGSDGKQCNACSWGYVTPFWGMSEEKMCLQTNNEWELTKPEDWDKKRLRDLKGANNFEMEITPEMNMCGVMHAVKSVKEKCTSTYGAGELEWKEDMDMDNMSIQQIVCMGAMQAQRGFSEVCSDSWDKNWDDIFKRLEDDMENGENWKDVLCFVFKKVRDLDAADTSNECSNLDESQYKMSMPVSFGAEVDAETSAVLFPIMKRLKNLETMNFASFADAGKAMMSSMGIEDMSEFTGWAVANELRDVGYQIPRGFRMAKFSFEPGRFEKSEFMCENGRARRDCDDHGHCERDHCRMYQKDEGKDLFCKQDECNNCAKEWFWREGEEEKEYECASCNFPETMPNGTLVRVSDSMVEAQYRCNEEYVMQECWSSMARCDYNSNASKIEFPKCVADRCEWPEVENAEKWRDWRDEKNWMACPPYAMYKCKDGWMSVNHHNRVECKTNENFRIENHMKCIEKCTFPETIDQGVAVETGRHEDGRYYAKYRCNEGFYLRGEREWGECDTEERDGKQVAVARLPRCRRGDTCQFPEQMGDARKEDEWFDEERGKKGARYRCPDGMSMEGHDHVECSDEDPSQVQMHEMKCFEEKKCEFPERIDGGYRVNEQTYDHNARYECDEGFQIDGTDWASCDRRTGYVNLPRCAKKDDCYLPDGIEGGYRSEKEHNRAQYRCHDPNQSLPDSIAEKDGWVECDGEGHSPEYPKCEPDSCHLPEHIDRGMRMEKRKNKARYVCDNENGYKLPDSIRERDGWVMCEDAEHKPEYPRCVTFDCVFKEIDNADRETRDDPTGMRAWYRCNEGFRLKNQVNEAKCDANGNVEYPHCIKNGPRCDFTNLDIDNGRVQEADRDDYSIKVECNEGYRPRDWKDRAFCGEDNEITFKPECERFQECEYPDSIPDGYKTPDRREGGVRYECNDGFDMQVDDWAHCDTSTGTITHQPECKRRDEGDDCYLPESIEGGKRAEKHHNRARYECHGEWRLPNSLRTTDGWVMCKGDEYHPSKPHCVRNDHDGECHFPDAIFAGYKMREEMHTDGQKYAIYVCFPPYVMTPNKDGFMGLIREYGKSAMEAYHDMAYIGACHDGHVMLPSCMEPRKARHCGIPNYIENGKAVEMYMKEHDEDKEHEEEKEREDDEYNRMDEEMKEMLKMMPMGARYQCNEGFMMHKTIKDDWGWCRRDGSFEIPSCEAATEWNEVEFKLHNGNEKKFADKEGNVFAGIVMARQIRMSGPVGDWEYGCNDGFNSHAAGAICRSLGFRHGAQTPLTKKMMVMSTDTSEAQRGFGWTGFGCKFDDTLASSANCRAERYEDAVRERGMKAKCFDFDKMAVKCFNHAEFNFTVSLTYSNRKISCRALAHKESYMLDLGKMDDTQAKFMMDDKELTGSEYVQKYKVKKGYFLKVKDLKAKDFKCISCEVHLRDMMLGKDEVCKDDAKKNGWRNWTWDD